MENRQTLEGSPFIQSGEDMLQSLINPPERTILDKYITMRDGVKIAAIISLPKDNTKKYPTLLVQTRYWRAMRLRVPFRWLMEELPLSKVINTLYNAHDYAAICVDVRGTGASFGKRNFPFKKEEVEDGNEILNWIKSQPWSNGQVVSSGGSYLGSAAEFLTTHQNSSLKTIVVGHCSWDALLDGASPGGVYNDTFMKMWSISGRYLDQNNPKEFRQNIPLFWLMAKGVKPVTSQLNPNLLEEAVKEHKANQYVYELTKDLNYRDDLLPDGNPVDYISTFYQKSKIEGSKIPILHWSSWLDSGYGDAVIHRFLNLNNPQIGILGDWNHGAVLPASQFYPERTEILPDFFTLLNTWMHHFDSCIGDNPPRGKILYYYTMGEEKWKKTTAWPPMGHEFNRWYLNKKNLLSSTPPQQDESHDTYKVNFRASTGIFNRWWALLGFPIKYGNRAKADKKLMVYTSAPLQEDLEITGNPIITLHLSTTHEDGVIYAYLEDIDQAGKVTYLTDGHIRFMHRKLSNDTPPYKSMVPYHSYKKKDALPVMPDALMEIKFGLYSTSVLVRKEHRLRVALAGHDKDTFKRHPAEGNPTLKIYHDVVNTSYIDLPIIKK